MVSGLMMTLQMTPRINGMVRRRLFDQIRYNLMVHTQAEEEILYPAMRHFMFMGGQSKVDESYRVHQRIKDLLNDLTTIDPTGYAFDAKLADLKKIIQHHVEEEEEEMFPLLMQRMSAAEQEALGRRIHDRKIDLKLRPAA
jgi:hemerythrin superfamily protein